MGEDNRVSKRSCPFCQHPSRDELEDSLLHGTMSSKDLDKEMSWRLNTSDRHFRNHMGQYHMAANPQCKICSHTERAYFEIMSNNSTISCPNCSMTAAYTKTVSLKMPCLCTKKSESQ